MTRNYWKKKITDHCIELGVYKESYDITIAKLSNTLEKLDAADVKFRASGSDPVVMFPNGNSGINPYLKVFNELNGQALKYLSELGLTPSSYKRITGEGKNKKAEEEEKPKGLAGILAAI